MARTLAVLSIFAVGALARADRGELRFSAAATARDANIHYAGVEGSSAEFGGRVRAGYGVTDLFEVGAGASFARASGIRMPGASIGGQPGALEADATAVEL